MLHQANKYVMSALHKTDVAIIGAGPVGLFAVFQCGMLGLRTHVIDALEDIGGQCAALYPEKPIYDIPGFPEIAGGELIARLEAQAAPFAPVYTLGQQAQTLEKIGDSWRIGTSSGGHIEAKAVLIAGGAGAFGPNRPPLKRLEEFEGRSIFYMVRRRAEFAGKRVVIAGGGDSALDWALSLAGVAGKVLLVHRRDKFRGAPESVARLYALAEEGKIELVIPYQLKGLEGADGRLTGVRVVSMEGAEKVLEADILLPFFGLAAHLGPMEGWGLDLRGHQIAVNPASCETNLPGVFAAGDIAAYEGKLRLILTGFAEVAQAAHAAYRIVNPGQELHFEYSTTKGIPLASGVKSGVK